MARAAITSKKVMIAPEPPKNAKQEEPEIPIEPITFDQAWNKYEYGLAKYVAKNRQSGKKKTGKNNIEYGKLKAELKARQAYIMIKVKGDGDQNGKKKLRGKKELPTYHAPNENEEYIVEMMLNSRVEKGKLDYLVLWDGWPLEWASWEPAKELGQARLYIKELHKRFQNKPGDPKLEKYAYILAQLGWDNDEGEENIDFEAKGKASSEVAEIKDKTIAEVEAEEEERDGASKAIAKSDSNFDVSDLDLDAVDPVDAADEQGMEVDDAEGEVTTAKVPIPTRPKNGVKSKANTTTASGLKTDTRKVATKDIPRKSKAKIVSPPPTVKSKKRTRRCGGEELVMLPNKPPKYKPSGKVKKDKSPYMEDTPDPSEDEQIVMQPPAKRVKATNNAVTNNAATTKVTKAASANSPTPVPEREETPISEDGAEDAEAAENQLRAGLQAVATSTMAASSVVDDVGSVGDLDTFRPAAEDFSSDDSSSTSSEEF